MTNLAGAIADGMLTHPTNTPPRYIREVILPRLKEGGVSDSSSRGSFQLMLGSFVATGVDDKGIAAERLKYKNLLAFLFSTPAYWPSLELFGWQDIGEQLLTCTRENRWQDMNALVSEEMLDAFLPTTHYGDIGELLTKWYKGLAGVLTFPVPTDPSNDSVAALVIESLKAGR
jgi:hypothetical protein